LLLQNIDFCYGSIGNERRRISLVLKTAEKRHGICSYSTIAMFRTLHRVTSDLIPRVWGPSPCASTVLCLLHDLHRKL
jgi:hypothetical protein